jgi:hypothetical protein
MPTPGLGLKNNFSQETITDSWLNQAADDLDVLHTQLAELIGSAGISLAADFNGTLVPGALEVDVSAGTAIVGGSDARRLRQKSGTTRVTGLTANASGSGTNRIWLLKDGTFSVTVTGSAPETGAQLCLTVDTNAAQGTAVNNNPSGRVNLAGLVTAAGLTPFAAHQSMGGFRLTNLADPAAAQDAATKAYADALKAGFDYKDSVRAATTAALPANTRSGSVLTASANGALAAVDGVTLVLNDRVLVKNEATGANNGIYYVSAVGDAGNPWTLTRATDADANAEVNAGLMVPVEEGTTNADTVWLLSTNNPVTLNTTALTFSQFGGGSGAPTGAQYLVLAADGTLSAERVLTPGDSLEAVDGGAGAAWTLDQKVAYINRGLAEGRLSTESGVSVSTATRTGQGTLYYALHGGNRIGLYNGSKWKIHTFTQCSLSIPSTSQATPTGNTTNGSELITGMSSTTGLYAGQVITGTGIPSGTTIISVDSASQITLSKLATATNAGTALICYYSVYDVFIYDNSGTITLEAVAWTNGTTRATALTTQDGIPVKSGDATRRYLGMFKLSTSTGTEVGGQRCLIWNLYNQVEIELAVFPTGSSWNYTTATWRPWHKTDSGGVWAEGFGNRFEIVQGFDWHTVGCDTFGVCSQTNTGVDVALGIDVDPVTVLANDAQIMRGERSISTIAGGVRVGCHWKGHLGIGFHVLQAVEHSVATGTTSWFGAAITGLISGMWMKFKY